MINSGYVYRCKLSQLRNISPASFSVTRLNTLLIFNINVPASSMCGCCAHNVMYPSHAYRLCRTKFADLQNHCTSLGSSFDHIGSCAFYFRNVHQISSRLLYFLLAFPLRLYILLKCDHLSLCPSCSASVSLLGYFEYDVGEVRHGNDAMEPPELASG